MTKPNTTPIKDRKGGLDEHSPKQTSATAKSVAPQLTSDDVCRHKHSYHTAKTAVRAKKRRNKAAGYNYLRHYQCNSCGFWHLTTQIKVTGQPVSDNGVDDD